MKALFLGFLTNLKAIILLKIKTKVLNNVGASGLHSFREKIKKFKKRMVVNYLVLTFLVMNDLRKSLMVALFSCTT